MTLPGKVVTTIALVGLLVFGSLCAVSLVRPDLVERTARTLLVAELRDRVGAAVETLDDGTLTRVGGALQRRIERTAEARAVMDARIRAVVDAMSDPDCPCRRWITALDTAAVDAEARAPTRLEAAIQARYADTARQLLREVRIFTGVNAALFGLLLVIAIVRRRAGLQLLLPTVVVVGGAGLAAAAYLFGQDWLHTLLFGDYLGWWYVAWAGGACALLGDILMNRARVTTRLFNALANALGSAVSAIPC